MKHTLLGDAYARGKRGVKNAVGYAAKHPLLMAGVGPVGSGIIRLAMGPTSMHPSRGQSGPRVLGVPTHTLRR